MNPTADRHIIEEAAAWFALLRDEAATDADRARWRDWLAEPAHARAWARVEAIAAPFQQLGRELATPARQTLARAHSVSRRRALSLLGSAGVAVGSAWLARQTLPWRDWAYDYALARAAYRTRVGEIHTLDLPDGSRLTLDTASAIDVDFDYRLRRVVLRDGGIFVATAPDRHAPPRRFVVDTAHGRITALGTRFAVQGTRDAVEVAVFEGAVRIDPADGAPGRTLAAGQQARFSRAGIDAVKPADPAREAWSRGLLIADRQRLDAFVRQLARYTSVPLAVAPEIAGLRVIGVYPIARPQTDVPATLLALEDVFPVQVTALAGGGDQGQPPLVGGYRVEPRRSGQ